MTEAASEDQKISRISCGGLDGRRQPGPILWENPTPTPTRPGDILSGRGGKDARARRWTTGPAVIVGSSGVARIPKAVAWSYRRGLKWRFLASIGFGDTVGTAGIAPNGACIDNGDVERVRGLNGAMVRTVLCRIHQVYDGSVPGSPQDCRFRQEPKSAIRNCLKPPLPAAAGGE